MSCNFKIDRILYPRQYLNPILILTRPIFHYELSVYVVKLFESFLRFLNHGKRFVTDVAKTLYGPHKRGVVGTFTLCSCHETLHKRPDTLRVYNLS